MLAFALVMAACKKENKNQQPEPDIEIIDDVAAEAEAIRSLNEDHAMHENGQLKHLFDTTNLKPLDEYIILFKSSFQPTLAETYSGPDDGKEAAEAMHTRNAKAKMSTTFDSRTFPVDSISEWFTVLSSGFMARLTPEQLKAMYRNDNVKCVFRNVKFTKALSEPTYTKNFTDGLFIHGYKTGTGISRTIWTIDFDGLQNSTYYNRISSLSKNVGSGITPNISGHGTRVAFVCAGKGQALNSFRGVSENARIAIVNYEADWTTCNTALTHIWIYSKNGDIVNCSWGSTEKIKKNDTTSAILEMEKNLLSFEGWQMAITIAAGNANSWASDYSPSRLGLLYKEKPTKYSFLYVVAAVEPVGTLTEIKNGTCGFKLTSYSNYGSAVRVAAIGSWQTPAGGQTEGTSFSAPTVAGVLYQQVNPANNPKYLAKTVKYTKGKYTFEHKIPTLLK